MTDDIKASASTGADIDDVAPVQEVEYDGE